MIESPAQPLPRPDTRDACPCGSGERFGACCGAGDRPPRGMVVLRRYLRTELCRQVVAYARDAPREAMTQDTSDGRTVTGQRVGERVDIGGIEEGVVAVVREAFVRHARACGVARIAWLERPQILAYGPGGRYIAHADADAWDRDRHRWHRVVDRDVSLLIYLDQDFEGGALYFPRFDYRLQPATGTLVLFPADARYAHCAEPVIRGERHVIVSWAAGHDVARVRSAPPEGAVPVAGGAAP